MSLYDDLGVSKDADRETIKRAYRKKAQKLHPDRPGGNAEKFHAITKAYDVLYDDARRANYDATGKDGEIVDLFLPDQQVSLARVLVVIHGEVDSDDNTHELEERINAVLAVECGAHGGIEHHRHARLPDHLLLEAGSDRRLHARLVLANHFHRLVPLKVATMGSKATTEHLFFEEMAGISVRAAHGHLPKVEL